MRWNGFVEGEGIAEHAVYGAGKSDAAGQGKGVVVSHGIKGILGNAVGNAELEEERGCFLFAGIALHIGILIGGGHVFYFGQEVKRGVR